MFADSDNFELILLVHHDLVHVEDSAQAVDQDWLVETCLLTYCNSSFVDQVNFFTLVISGLNYLPMLEIVICQLDYHIIDELAFTISKKVTELSNEFPKQALNKFILQLGRKLLVKVEFIGELFEILAVGPVQIFLYIMIEVGRE